jgi:hypothetical protein
MTAEKFKSGDHPQAREPESMTLHCQKRVNFIPADRNWWAKPCR